MMTNKDSLGHTTCECADTILSNLKEPDFFLPIVPSALHLRPVRLISLVHPSLLIRILIMTCAAERGSQRSNGLSSAMRTPMFCVESVMCMDG